MLVAGGAYTEKLGHVHGPLGVGVHTYRIDEDGVVTPSGAEPLPMMNPTWLVRHPSKPLLYAANEAMPGTPGLTAMRFDEKTGALSFVSQTVFEEGSFACHVDTDGEFLVVACYMPSGSSGFVHLLPLAEDGTPDAPCHRFEITAAASGTSGDEARGGLQAGRQEAPHPHMACMYRRPDGKTGVLVPDLGVDSMYNLVLNKQDRRLDLQGFARLPVGTGPRHCAFDVQGGVVYVLGELTTTIDVIELEGMTSVQRISTLPASVEGQKPSEYLAHNPFFLDIGGSGAAAVKLSPDGRKLYASNRGHDSIAVFALEGGRLRLEHHLPSRGRTPRDFLVDPKGRHLLVMNQDSGTIVTLPIGSDSDSGSSGTVYDASAALVTMVALAP